MFYKLNDEDDYIDDDQELKGFCCNKFNNSDVNKLLRTRKKQQKKNVARIKIDVTDWKFMLNKLFMIARLKLTVGPLYIVTLIEIMKVIKKIFVFEIILGKEIRIPDKLMMYQTKD